MHASVHNKCNYSLILSVKMHNFEVVNDHITLELCIFIQFEARLRSNIWFTLRGNLAVFTRLVIILPKVNRFWWNLEHSEYIVGGWPWQILGAICAVATVWEAGELFVWLITHDFADFPSATFHEILTPQRPSVRRWKLSERNFESFSLKTQKILNKCPGLATSGSHNSITNRPKFTIKIALYENGMSSSHSYHSNRFKVIFLPRTTKVPVLWHFHTIQPSSCCWNLVHNYFGLLKMKQYVDCVDI